MAKVTEVIGKDVSSLFEQTKLIVEILSEIASAVHYAKDQHVLILDTIDDPYSPTDKLREPAPKSSSRARPR